MEKFNQSEQPTEETRVEKFFAENIDVVPISRDEFVEMMKLKFPDKTDEEILQTKGVNFDQDGKVVVLMREDIYPAEYMPYMETHEKWEAYVARKGGYNLFKKSVREYKEDKNIEDFDEETKAEYLNNIGKYNYDFRHEFAVYKEYEHAMNDEKLDVYHEWIMKLREQEKPTATIENLELIENDTKIRESVYKKLKEGGKHYFLRQ